MALVSELIRKLASENLNETIAYQIWTRDDVKNHCEDLEVELTDDQIDEVLIRFTELDRNIGQSWDSLTDIIVDINDPIIKND